MTFLHFGELKKFNDRKLKDRVLFKDLEESFSDEVDNASQKTLHSTMLGASRQRQAVCIGVEAGSLGSQQHPQPQFCEEVSTRGTSKFWERCKHKDL